MAVTESVRPGQSESATFRGGIAAQNARWEKRAGKKTRSPSPTENEIAFFLNRDDITNPKRSTIARNQILDFACRSTSVRLMWNGKASTLIEPVAESWVPNTLATGDMFEIAGGTFEEVRDRFLQRLQQGILSPPTT